jgi:histidine triad (HIT) family protein
MSDFYCDEVLSGSTPVQRVVETARVLAFQHTQPSYPVHIVVIPKLHIPSLVDFAPGDDSLLLELLGVIQQVARQVISERGACRVITNLGEYQESKHLHWHIVSGERLPAITLAD